MNTLQVGVLFSQRGFSASYGASQLRGTFLAIDERNSAGGIGGRLIEPIIYDPGSNPGQYSSLANRLLMDDGVSVIFGCTSSFSRKAVSPWVEKRNALLFYPTCYEGFDFSPNIIYTGPSPNQLHVQLHKYLAEIGRSSFYLLGSDYIFPHESNRIMKDLVAQRDGEVVREKYVPLICDKNLLRDIISDVVATKADVLLSTLVGSAASLLYDAFYERGLTPDDITIASLTTSEPDVSAMEHVPLAGHVTASPYFATIDTPENRLFSERFAARFGSSTPIDTCAEAAYFQVHLFAEAMSTLDEVDADRLREALVRVEVAAPQGKVRVDADNNHTFLWPRIGLTDGNGSFKVVRTSDAPVKPDPYLIDYVGGLVAA